MTLVDVLVDVLDGAYIEGNFHIYMAFQFQEEHGIVRNNIMVVHFMTSDIVLPAIVRTPIEWISIFIYRSLLSKGLGEMFRTLATLHAWGIGVLWSTWSMGHHFTDQFVQPWIGVLIWKDGPDQGINIFWSPNLRTLVKPYEKMHVW